MTIKDDGNMRSFDTGATRDTAEGKLAYNGFYSPFVMRQFARFMNMNRLQSDGKLRDANNWQKGIDMSVYRESLSRHYQEFWEEVELKDKMSDMMSRTGDIKLMAAACGIMFNIQGYVLEWLKRNPEVRFDDDEPTPEMAERKKKLAKKDAVRDYNEAMTIHLSDIQPGEVPLPTWVETLESAFTAILKDAGEVNGLKVVVNPDERDYTPCTCSPGDCDCDTGRIYGFAMPTDDEDADVEESCCSCLYRQRPGDQMPCLVCEDDCNKYTRED